MSTSVRGPRVDPLRIPRVCSEMRVLLVQLRPSGAEKEERNALGPVGKVFQERQQGGIGPVQVLEDEHRLTPRGQKLDEATPCSEGLLLGYGIAACADEREETSPQPRDVGVVCRERRGQLGRGLLGESDSRIPHSAFTISPSAQKAIPSPYGSERPCRQRTRPGRFLDVAEELRAESALAHPRLADDRHELAGALLGRALEHPDQERLLELAADER